MSPTYYLVNHTTKEFCFFENDASIFDVLEEAIKKCKWKKTDHVAIDSEDASHYYLLDYLKNNNYRMMDEESSEESSEEDDKENLDPGIYYPPARNEAGVGI
jgi:hypothetical protein